MRQAICGLAPIGSQHKSQTQIWPKPPHPPLPLLRDGKITLKPGTVICQNLTPIKYPTEAGHFFRNLCPDSHDKQSQFNMRQKIYPPLPTPISGDNGMID